MLITIISGAPADHRWSGAGERFPAEPRLWQANGYYVRRSSYKSSEFEDGNVIVKTDAREFWMRVNLLHRVSFWRRRLIIPFQIDIAKTHGELAGGEAM